MEKAIMPALTGRHYIAVAAVFIVILSWLGVLDTASENYVNSAIVQATVAFASARTLNAVISVAQNTEVSIVVFSMAIGELLDPLNDLVEQYSTLMKYAIASLLVQKLLLVITSSTVFKIFLTVAGVWAAGTALMGREKAFAFSFRLFVFVAFLRFALVLAVALNGLVSHFFVNEQIDAEVERLQATTEVVEQVSGDETVDPKRKAELAARKDELLTEKVDHIKVRDGFEVSLSGALVNLDSAKKRLAAAEELIPWKDKFFDSDALRKEKADVNSAQASVEYFEGKISEENDDIEALDEEITTIDNQLMGKANGWIETARNAATSAVGSVKENFTSRVSGLVDELNESVSNILDLMAAFLLKTLILPLIFLYMVVMLTRIIWGVDMGRYV